MERSDTSLQMDEEQRVINRRTYRTVLWERRCMAAATAVTALSLAAFVVASFTTEWVIVRFSTPRFDYSVRVGLWGEWRTRTNATASTSTWLHHFPVLGEKYVRLSDESMPHFYGAQALLIAVTAALMGVGTALAAWTFSHHRYMYKRLVAALHLLTAMCVIGVIESIVHSISEWTQIVAGKADDDETAVDYTGSMTYGAATVLAWVVFGVHLAAAVVFAVASRKRKGSRAATLEFEQEDRPVHIYRS